MPTNKKRRERAPRPSQAERDDARHNRAVENTLRRRRGSTDSDEEDLINEHAALLNQHGSNKNGIVWGDVLLDEDETEQEAVTPVTIQRLWAMLQSERQVLIGGTTMAVLSTIGEMCMPLITGNTFNEVAATADQNKIDQQILVMGVLVFVIFILNTIEFILFGLGEGRLSTRVRKQLFSTILRQEVAYFDKQLAGALNSRITTDVAYVAELISSGAEFLADIITAIGSLGFMFYTSWRMALISLAPFPILLVSSVLFGGVMAKLTQRQLDVLSDASKISVETFSNIRVVRYFCQEKQMLISYARYVDASYQLAIKVIYAQSVYIAIGATLANAAYLFQFWYGAGLVAAGPSNGGLNIGDFVSYLFYVQSSTQAMSALLEWYTSLIESIGATQRIMDLLERTPLMPLNGGATLPKVEGRVDFMDVVFRYPTRPKSIVLKGVTFTMYPHKTMAICGTSGGGKSSIVQVLMRLYPVDQGRIFLDKNDVANLDPSWLRRQVGIVSQEPTLFSYSISRNISFGFPDAPQARIVEAAKVAQCHDFIMAQPDKYDTIVGEKGIALSGGQRQRIAIARALIGNPKILIFDEATSALDAQSEHDVTKAIQSVMKGRTAMVIAHRLSTIVNADQIIVLANGRVAEQGKHSDLLRKKGLYAKLVAHQMLAGQYKNEHAGGKASQSLDKRSGGGRSGGGRSGGGRSGGGRSGGGRSGGGRSGGGRSAGSRGGGGKSAGSRGGKGKTSKKHSARPP